MNEFTDIKITGSDEDLTHVPDASRPAMHDVYLKLSDTPPAEWMQIFDQVWQSHFYHQKRRARLEGNHIVIYCALEELEKDHKPELLAVTSQVNHRYRQYADQQALHEKQEEERQASADQKKKDALGRLKFD